MWYEPIKIEVTSMPFGGGITVGPNPYILIKGGKWCIEVKSVDKHGDTTIGVYHIEKDQYDTLGVGKFISTKNLLAFDSQERRRK